MNKKNLDSGAYKKNDFETVIVPELIIQRKSRKSYFVGAVFFVLVILIGIFQLLLYPKWKNLNYEWGKKNLSEGKFDAAAKNFESASGGNYDAEATYKLAVTKYNQKDFEGAITVYQKLISKDVCNPSAHNGLGNIYRDQKKYSLAEESYRKSIGCDETYVAAYSNLAIMLMDLGKKEEANKIVDEGLKNNPESSDLKNIRQILEE
jgi:tetratricopeptide (TPR) repeat protein